MIKFKTYKGNLKMAQLLNSTQAHTLADQSNETLFQEYLVQQHNDIKRLARSGAYEKVIRLPTQYANKGLNFLTYFHLFGYKVTVQRNIVTIGW